MKQIIIILLFPLLVVCNKKEKLNNVPKRATTIIENLKVRMAPNLTATVIEALPAGTNMRILRRSVDKTKIGKQNDYWYKIKTEQDLKGWVYGAFLNIGLKAKQVTQSIVNKNKNIIGRELIGKWFAVTSSGELTSYYITFFSSGKLFIGTGLNISQVGFYNLEIKPSKTKILISKLKKPLITSMTASLRGVSLTLKGVLFKYEYSFRRVAGGYKFKDGKRIEEKPKSESSKSP